MAYAHAEIYKCEGVTVCKFQDTVFQDIPSVSKCFVCVRQAFENCISVGTSNFYLFVGGALAFQFKNVKRPADTQKHFIDDMMIKQIHKLKTWKKKPNAIQTISKQVIRIFVMISYDMPFFGSGTGMFSSTSSSWSSHRR